MILHRLGSYASQHSVHQRLSEIGRVERTLHVLRTIDDKEFRRQQGRELNKAKPRTTSRAFLFFGKQGALRGRGFDQLRSSSCLGLLHNAVVAWNIINVGRLVEQLRTDGYVIGGTTLAQTTPLMRKQLNPFGGYHLA